jgi:glycosyltransferase involved in cell wall biosynthesis
MVYWARLGSHWSTIWLKYIGQSVTTWRILLRDRPDAVFVMSPPVIAVLAVYPYCLLRGIPLVVDAHTGAFANPRWRHFQWLQRWLCRRAATTIVTGTYLAETLASYGADATILPDVPVRYPESGGVPATGADVNRFRIAVICSFDRDEPIEVIIDAARAVAEVDFLVTGNPANAQRLSIPLPPNLILTGFLDNASYGRLLRDAHAVMALTTGQHTMLRAAYEAVYQGTPIIISDSALLREEFDQGAVFVQNSVEDIVRAVKILQQDLPMYRQQVSVLRQRKERRWERNKELLLAKINQAKAAHAR